MQETNINTRSLKRVHRQAVLLNELEYNAVQAYCKKYKVKNKSKLIREALFKKVLKKYDDDYPTLFDEKVLNSLVRY